MIRQVGSVVEFPSNMMESRSSINILAEFDDNEEEGEGDNDDDMDDKPALWLQVPDRSGEG